MRLSVQSWLISLDLWIFETPEDDDTVRAVAGSPWPADSTIAGVVDPLQQADELPADRMGFTG